MIIMLTRMDLSDRPEAFERSDGAGSAERYLSVPGLICKGFFNDPEKKIIGGFFLWQSEAAMKSFLDSGGLDAPARKFGRHPQVTVYQCSAFVQGPEFEPSAKIVVR